VNPTVDNPIRQIPLSLRLRDTSEFQNYWSGQNRELVDRCRQLALAPASRPADWVFLWGEPGTGKTHLLEAICHAAGSQNGSPMYLSLRDLAVDAWAVLDGIEVNRPICIDDIDAIVGRPEWERGLFGLYERLRVSGGILVAAGRSNPATLRFGLLDLATRLGSGLVYQIHPMSDGEKILALRLRASRRGLEMSDDVGRYLLGRFARDTHSLFALLDRLDTASLAAQRRLTVPFLRSLE